jgi:hypothetical protein
VGVEVVVIVLGGDHAEECAVDVRNGDGGDGDRVLGF